MKPLEILAAEHRVIEQILDCLEIVAHRALDAQRIELADARRCIELLATLYERCHRAKEEQHLFPALARRGGPAQVALIASLIREHDLARRGLVAMREALDSEALDARGATQRFARAALGYVELLRAHVAKEEGTLFADSQRLLSPEDEPQILLLFGSVEQLDLEPGTRRRLYALADELAVHLGVPPGAERRPAAER